MPTKKSERERAYIVRLRRRLFNEISGGVCAVCGTSDGLTFHHFAYPFGKAKAGRNRAIEVARMLREGHGDSVTVLCRKCHRAAHKAGK